MLRSFAPWLLALGLSGSALAQSVTEVAPTNGAVGTTLTITGTGFGSAKPAAALIHSTTGKKTVLKVTAFSNTQITATLSAAAVSGIYDLQVDPAGSAPAFQKDDAFTVESPSITAFNPTTGFPGDSITLTAQFLGSKKGKILVGGKSAPITAWSNTSAVFKMPPSLKAGVFDVSVSNGSGADNADDALTIPQPDPENIDPAVAAPGDPVQISGSQFGIKKGKVLVGTKSAAISAWTDTSITFAAPSLAAGIYDITVSNAVGSAILTSWLTVSPTGQPSLLSGIAAKGAPIGGAGVTAKDSKGKSSSSTTAMDGTFQINVTGFSAPFLMRVDVPGGGILYSFAMDASAATVHPISDVIVRIWYALQGILPNVAYTNITSHPAPSPDQLAAITDPLEAHLALWFGLEGLNVATFDLLKTAFNADGTGFDRILDRTTTIIGVDTFTFSIQDAPTSPTIEQEIILTPNAANSTLRFQSATTTAGGSTTSDQTVVIPSNAQLLSAIAGVEALLGKLATVVASKGAQLSASHVTSLIAADFLGEGKNRTLFAGEAAQSLRGASIDLGSVTRIHSFDPALGILFADIEMLVSAGSASETIELERMGFRKSGASWLFYGDRAPAEISLDVETRIDLPGFAPHFANPHPHINVDVRAEQGTIASVTVSGGGVFNNTPVLKDPSVEIEEIEFAPGQTTQITRELFFLSATPGTHPPAGTQFTVTVTPVSGPPQTFTITSGATTTEGVNILAPTAFDLAAAQLGGTLAFQWTLPETFSIQSIDVGAFLFGSGVQCSTEADVLIIGTDATSATFQLPTTCNSQAVSSVNLNLSIDGTLGERIIVIYTLGGP
ncbi:MAG: IPT/TIG domain-containing protein [Planctomycetes bacterium]|nr:IPT/TIG domain-containing protein [Planctomycetota bacterium]